MARTESLSGGMLGDAGNRNLGLAWLPFPHVLGNPGEGLGQSSAGSSPKHTDFILSCGGAACDSVKDSSSVCRETMSSCLLSQ